MSRLLISRHSNRNGEGAVSVGDEFEQVKGGNGFGDARRILSGPTHVHQR